MRALDAVLLDFRIPDIEGKEILAEIRRISAELPVFMMSGSHEGVVRQEIGELKINGFLAKPFGREQLLELLRTLPGRPH